MLKAVLFDLDGTLLPVDTAKFMQQYMQKLALVVAPVVDPDRFTRALMASTNAMMASEDPATTNYDIFWSEFRSRLEDCMDDLEPVIDDFYGREFYHLGQNIPANPHARQAVEAALDRGLQVALATNPIFPRSAIRDRMKWAGVDDLPWDLITSYEEMHFCKPLPAYFHEIATLLEVKPEECIMVGNDARDDLVPSTIGMQTCLVSDYLVNTGETELQADWTGSLAELAGFLASMDLNNGIAV